jgi:hypothetical protein
MRKPLQHPAELAEYTHAINRIETINAKNDEKACGKRGQYYYPAVRPKELLVKHAATTAVAG